MLKNIYNNAIHGIGLVCLMWIAVCNWIPDAKKMPILYAMVVFLFFFCTLENLLFYQVRLNYRQCWIRRTILTGASALVVETLFILFGVYSNLSVQKIIINYIIVIIIEFAVMFTWYFLADQNQKRALEKINEKLKKNTDK
ncbi:MAG: hypothetical protein IJX28_08500 [Clostridia bacterium]|nr:hypothetical protein [Clostridia bacterium]